MLGNAISVGIWIAIVALVAFAWAKGGRAERFGALAILLGALGVSATHVLLPRSAQPIILLIDDAALAVAFLMLAMRFVSPWLGVAMLLQAVQFSLHAYYLVVEKPHDYLYKSVNNINTVGVLLCVLFGTILAWRRSARAAK
ncbi:hypothetical protein [Caulobacter hibisci]|uniref:Uncharacterized protein n=1 Tax=Caulobacter hibisci TaxID=2035993 RepID=A0ABS0T3W4_9CAUL|nr:hypothetical protein [Caulobacter hibisci]MBI1686562.1 hypothetical protein [Caulobacter hibisci]